MGWVGIGAHGLRRMMRRTAGGLNERLSEVAHQAVHSRLNGVVALGIRRFEGKVFTLFTIVIHRNKSSNQGFSDAAMIHIPACTKAKHARACLGLQR